MDADLPVQEISASDAGLLCSNGSFSIHRATGLGVRRDKAALFQWVQAPPG